MPGPVRLLFVDDSEPDVLLMVRRLTKAGFDVTYRRVQTPETMTQSIDEEPWDAIIADFTMPRFTGRQALEALKQTGKDIPFILATGTVTEARSVDMMSAGAHDIILKDDLSRLAPALTRELLQASIRLKHRLADQAAKRSERTISAILDSTPAAIIAYSTEGRIVRTNSACDELFGTACERLLGELVEDVIGDSERDRVVDRIWAVFQGEASRGIEWSGRRPDGSTFDAITGLTPVYGEGEEVSMGLSVSTDITAVKQAEAQKREFYRRTLLAATEGKLDVVEVTEIEQLGGTTLQEWQLADLKDLDKVRAGVDRASHTAGMSDERVDDLVLSAAEAATDAIRYAGGGTAELKRREDTMIFSVEDQGPGIAEMNLPEVALLRGYSTSGTLGMGYKIMISLSDKVYLASSPTGTVVAVEMSIHPEE